MTIRMREAPLLWLVGGLTIPTRTPPGRADSFGRCKPVLKISLYLIISKEAAAGMGRHAARTGQHAGGGSDDQGAAAAV